MARDREKRAPRLTRRQFVLAGAAAGAATLTSTDALIASSRVLASVSQAQTPLPSANIPKYVTALRTFSGNRVNSSSFTTTMQEFQQIVLPPSMYPSGFANGTWVWGYKVDSRAAQWPGFTVQATRGTPTTITYVNNLPVAASRSNLEKLLTIDQTIHWADPLNAGNSFKPYAGPIPGVVHLHGAEVPSAFDGAPEAWFTVDGRHGRGYNTLNSTAANAAVYRYPNTQPATTLWFHDHTLGITRINVFSGLAAFYLVRDQFDTGATNNPLRLPADGFEIELMIQDRLFDTNGQLRFSDGSNPDADLNGPPTNPKTHPFWIPEYFGDAMVVNGTTWPFLNVEPRRYRFRIVNACNARFLSMNLTEQNNVPTATPPSVVPFWQIGTDGGFLDRPVKLNDPANASSPKLVLGPSERADVIIDFSNLAGHRLILTNDGIFPFPSGGPPDPNLDGQILRIRVVNPLSSQDNSFNPANGGSLRGGANQPAPIVRLANPTTGAVASGVSIAKKRQLVIFEQDTFAGVTDPNSDGPIESFLNNTKWKGLRDGTSTPVPGSVQDQQGQGIWMTELPRVGATELWELVDTTPDAHPIHIHLIQFQVLNRQSMDIDNYTNTWASKFPGGTFAGQEPDGSFGMVTYAPGTIIPGYGPPSDYNTPNADGAVGGNPAVSPFLNGPVVPPDPNEAGWKDTFKILPGMVNRVLVRWAPTETALNGVAPGQNKFQFDPTTGPGYIWHCHILDHEDNEMMRPYNPTK
ncbi:MAG TPA: multicopper oxidase domain-containing protein [Candidatus Dormibacteraeota bacterium]|nr:multicopper oxidase domain-containing protein [Candidatus Dormibacteraeota bacterium]